MKLKSLMQAAAAIIAVALTSQVQASAVLYDDAGFVTGTQSFSQAFNISGPGTLTVSLTNVAWPVQLASLNLVLTAGGQQMGSVMGNGVESFDIEGGGNVFALWFGTAKGPLNTGVYSLKVEFTAADVGTPVPLPASGLLLLSGLGLLLWQRRTRNDFSQPFAGAT